MGGLITVKKVDGLVYEWFKKMRAMHMPVGAQDLWEQAYKISSEKWPERHYVPGSS